jgi:hypothetical protein
MRAFAAHTRREARAEIALGPREWPNRSMSGAAAPGESNHHQDLLRLGRLSGHLCPRSSTLHTPAFASQVLPEPQLPQLTPHTGSTPQVRPRQSGTHCLGSHVPLGSLQLSPLPHEPQLKPQTGSKPHSLPLQSGTQAARH